MYVYKTGTEKPTVLSVMYSTKQKRPPKESVALNVCNKQISTHLKFQI